MTGAPAVVVCLVCGTDAGETEQPGGDGLRRCGACNFVWTATSASSGSSPEHLYDGSYFRDGGYEDYFVPSARRFEAGRRVEWLLSFGRPATLVEAGCAAGFFVEATRNAGIAAQGVEVSEDAARYGREELGQPVQDGRFESASFGTTFDAVCAFHVLEHVEDPRAFLDAAWRVLTPGGLLLLEVPNISSTAARRLGPVWPGLQPRYHRWHFGPESLARLLTDRGFEIVHQDTVVFRYYMPPRYRRRQGRRLVAADVRNLGSLRLTHPRRADLLRLVARRPGPAMPAS